MNEVYSKDLGIVTAYGYALSKGYTGTEEQFATLMASYATIGQQAVDAALAAEGYAVGTHDGEPVPSTDPAYENNAKYYAEQIEAESESFARIDGSYDSMTVGNAEQLISTISTEDSVPYVFRTSGGAADIGDREQGIVVGGTVNWNQMAPPIESGYGWRANTVVATMTLSDGIATVTATSGNKNVFGGCAGSYLANHKYLIKADVNPSRDTTKTQVGLNGATQSNRVSKACVANTWTTIEGLVTSSSDVDDSRFAVYLNFVDNSINIGDTIQFKNVMWVDLTAMFGTAIADYIYSVEQATAGTGVALAKRWGNIVKPYYPYQANGLVSVAGLQSHDMTGFNQFNAANGTAKLLGGKQYQITGTYTSLAYTDVGGAAETITPDANGLFTPTNNGTLTITGGGSDTCIHFVHDGSRNDEYEPYEKHSYPLDSSLTLRGVPKLNESNELYYDGDRYLPDGTVERRYGIVDLGTLSWSITSAGNFFATISGRRFGSKIVSICSLYRFWGNGSSTELTNGLSDKEYGFYRTTSIIMVKDIAYTDAATFKTAMSGVMLVYELETPTTESAQSYAENQYVDDWGVEEYVISSEADYIPCVGHETKYPSNLRDKLQHLPSLSANGDGTYAITQTGSQMSLVHLPAVLPALPSEDGTYVLKATVASGTATLTWVAE